MRVLVLGATGMLGHKLVQQLSQRYEVWAGIRTAFDRVARFGICDRERTITGLDAADEHSVETAIITSKPEVVLNAVGVVKQVERSNDAVATLLANSVLPHRLAELGRHHGFRLITISTDCVFSGRTGAYNEADVPDAQDLYGRTKLLGEIDAPNCLTLRTSIIGRELWSRHGLLEWAIANAGGKVNGYRNAVFSGFPTIIFADIISDLIGLYDKVAGVYHVSSEPITKFDLLTRLNDAYKLDLKIVATDEPKIDRSLDSTRFRKATGFVPISWNKMIERLVLDATPYSKWQNQEF